MAKTERNKAFIEIAGEIAAELVEISKKVDCLLELQKPKPSYNHHQTAVARAALARMG